MNETPEIKRDRFRFSKEPDNDGHAFHTPKHESEHMTWKFVQAVNPGGASVLIVWMEVPRPVEERANDMQQCSSCTKLLGVPYNTGLRLSCACGTKYVSEVVRRRYTWVLEEMPKK
jgi:hypothetical protein